MDTWSFGKLVLSMFSTTTSTVFSTLLISYFIISILYRRGKIGTPWAAGISKTAVSALPTIGVLGTFYGIALGLLDFDVSNIDASVPTLLEGLKISFLTSILGIALSIALRLYDHARPAEAGGSGATIDDLNQSLARVAEENRLIREAVGGDGDNTAVTQLKNLRTDFRDFASKMAEDSTARLVEALEAVMRDFNAKINEQFGDNFKQLNEAVGAMLTWQQQYQAQVETLTARFDQARNSIEQVNNSVASIANAMQPVPQMMEQLADVVKTMDFETGELERQLEAFAQLSNDAKEAFPTIQQNVENLTNRFGAAVQTSTTNLQRTLEQHREVFDGELHTLTDAASRMQGQIDSAVRQTSANITEQMGRLDREMQNEINRVMQAMGNQLTALSTKFVQDYSPLTDQLRSVVRMAEGLDGRDVT